VISNVGGVAVRGIGKALPDRVVTNSEIATELNVTDEWIESRTGIKERHVASPSESTSTFAAQASRRALDSAGVSPDQVDLVIVGTCTPDHAFPSTACRVQHEIGATRAAAFDLNAACSGFVYSAAVGANFISNGGAERVLIVGAEVLSRSLNPDDPVTRPLFGDGAGAVLLEAHAGATALTFDLGSDGSGAENVIVPAGGTRMPASADTVDRGLHYIRMAGREVFRSAVHRMSEVGRHLGPDGFDLVIGHQANKRILDECRRELGLAEDRMFINIDRYGNTSAASIPIALFDAWESGRLNPGDRVLFLAFGAGYTWGGLAMQWQLDRDVVETESELAATR
jgi:3-oxoacyl-[acyl-carrier-protein] synthase-3